MDLLILILFIYNVIAFYRHPASVGWLNLDNEVIGGKEYILCLLGVLSYIAVSFLPIKFAQLRYILKINFFLSLLMIIFSLVRGVLFRSGPSTGPAEDAEIMEAAKGTRFSLLVPIGTLVLHYVYASTPITDILKNAKKVLAICFGAVCVLLSGWRSTFIAECLFVAMIALIKRELTLLILIATACYGALFFLSQEKALDDLPFGIQRSLKSIPGIHVSKEIEKDAEGSSDWRVVMWKWALDPRTGYIKDYIWGDGFGMSVSWHNRYSTALIRGTVSGGDQRYFAANGVWHSGWITTMHRLGIVGLVLLVIYQIIISLFILKTALIFKRIGSKELAYFCHSYLGVVVGLLIFHLSAGSLSHVYAGFVYSAVIKLFYCSAREEGLTRPLFLSEPYIPLTIREIEKSKEQSLV